MVPMRSPLGYNVIPTSQQKPNNRFRVKKNEPRKKMQKKMGPLSAYVTVFTG